MSGLLLRGTDLNGLPVVSIDEGDALAEVKDVVYSPERGALLGFTLNKRGFFSGKMKAVLAYDDLAAIGRDAVMVEDLTAVTEGGESLSKVVERSSERNVLGNDVLTDAGRRLGEVIDVVIEVTSGEVVGYELQGDNDLQAHAGQPLLIPIPATLAVSGSVLMVPASVEPYIRDDLSGFGAAVDEFRGELPREGTQA
jgi:uncharacterized protein YrrD